MNHILPDTPQTPFIGNTFLNNLAIKLGFSRDRAEKAAISALRIFREVFTNDETKMLEAMLPAAVSSPALRYNSIADSFAKETHVPVGHLDLSIAMDCVLHQFIKVTGAVPSGRAKKDYTE